MNFLVNGEPVRPSTAMPARDVTANDLAQLRSQFRGGNVLLPNDAGYGQVRFFNGRFDHIRPAGIVQPTSDEGVREAINFMTRNGIRFSVRGGGHHYEGHSQSRGVVIDLSRLQADLANQRLESSRPGAEANLITVGAGNNLGQLYTAMSQRNRVVPAGTADTVGAIGHALGGGLGDLTPQFGYMAQNLEQVRLVTYTGQILDINDQGITEIRDGRATPYQGNVTGADFMSALRGGGQALAGIVTQAKFRTHDVSRHDMRYFEHKPANALSRDDTIRLISAWQNWQTSHPEFAGAVSSKLNITRSGDQYSVDISGVIATTNPSQVEAIRRSMGEFTSLMGGAPQSKFSSRPQSMAEIYAQNKDSPELFNNAARKHHTVRSSMIPGQIPSDAVRYLVNNMIPGGDNPVTIYAAGGATFNGIERTSLPRASLLVEMESVTRGNSSPDRLNAYHTGFMQASGNPYSYANYPGNGRIVTDPALIQRIRDEFDPRRIVQNPLADIIQSQNPHRGITPIAQQTATPARSPQAQA